MDLVETKELPISITSKETSALTDPQFANQIKKGKLSFLKLEFFIIKNCFINDKLNAG